MNIELFIKQMNGEHKEGVIEKHIIRQYIPFEEKVARAKKIIEISCYKDVIDSDGNTQKMFWVNSTTKHFLTVRSMIEMYTDLTFSEDAIKDYNMLCEKKYDEKILNAIPIDDARQFIDIVEMTFDDEDENVNSIEGRIKNFVFGFDSIIKSAIEKIALEQIEEDDSDAKVELQSEGVDNRTT